MGFQASYGIMCEEERSRRFLTPARERVFIFLANFIANEISNVTIYSIGLANHFY
jgi:hypothetical protein